MGLVKFIQPWDIILSYCNNQFEKHLNTWLTLARGALSVPLLMSMWKAFSLCFHTLIKFCYTEALEWSSLVPGPEVKSSSWITNPTPFTICSKNLLNLNRNTIIKASWIQRTWVWASSGRCEGQWSLASCNPWGGRELKTTEQLNNKNIQHFCFPVSLRRLGTDY